MAANSTSECSITEDEAALYDRQIRLWGLDAQKRLRAARVLLVGMSGLGAEVAKNVTLSGIKSITLLDNAPVMVKDLSSQFLVDRSHLGKNRAESSLKRTQDLNPMVRVTAEDADISEKPTSYFLDFDVVCVTCCTRGQMERIDNICHENNIMFFGGDVFGYYGTMFADLNEHEYAKEVLAQAAAEVSPCVNGEPAPKKMKTEAPETKTVKQKSVFTRLKQSYSIDWSNEEYKKKVKKTPTVFFINKILLEFRERFGRDPCLSQREEDIKSLSEMRQSVLASSGLDENVVPENFTQYCFVELGPVCAVVGGILGQEIIKAVSQNDTPHNNHFFYDGVEGVGMVDCIA